MKPTRHLIAALLPVVAAAFLSAPAAAQQSGTYAAFAAIDSEGLVVVTGPESFRTLSSMDGDLFLDNGSGPADTADMMCTSSINNDTASGTMEGSGECVVTAPDGAQMYAIWTCEGTVFVGCDGDFQVVSGNGRLAGVTGGGLMTVRTMETQVAAEDAVSGAALSSGTSLL